MAGEIVGSQASGTVVGWRHQRDWYVVRRIGEYFGGSLGRTKDEELDEFNL